MGFRLMKNFAQPYFSSSLDEFWRRWHISLSTWFRDYLYFPLGGNRVSRSRWIINIMVVFTISGLWHGARWTFVAWGAIHGILLAVSVLVTNLAQNVLVRKKIDGVLHYASKAVGVVFTFMVVTISWVFFRADSLHDAWYILIKCGEWFASAVSGTGVSVFDLKSIPAVGTVIPAFAAVIVMETIQLFQMRGSIREWIAGRPWWVRWFFWYGLAFSILFFGYTGSNQFIYFQF